MPAVTADLFEVGDDALVMRSALLPGYTAYGNRIHLDAIRIGRNAYVGEQSVLEIGSAIGDFGQLGHASSLQRGQRVPDGKRYAGSPAEETTTRFRLADEAPARPLRRALFTAARLAFVLAVAGALAEAVVIYSDERADRRRRRARAEAAGTRRSPCCRWRRRPRSP